MTEQEQQQLQALKGYHLMLQDRYEAIAIEKGDATKNDLATAHSRFITALDALRPDASLTEPLKKVATTFADAVGEKGTVLRNAVEKANAYVFSLPVATIEEEVREYWSPGAIAERTDTKE